MTTTTLNQPMPRSYLHAKDKKGLSQNLIYAREASAAIDAGDEEATWAWMAKTNMPNFAKLALADTFGKEFLESKGFQYD